MNPAQSELDQLRSRLAEATQKVPLAVQHGSVQSTRSWLDAQQKAVKLLNKKGAKATDLRAALDRLKGATSSAHSQTDV